MADYSEEIADAIEDIRDAGVLCTFERTSEVIPDAAKPWRKSDGAPVTCQAHGVLTEYKKSQQSQGFTAGSEDSRDILPGDLILLVAGGDPGLTFRPAPRDYVTVPNAGKFGVVDTFSVAPAGEDILLKLWIRK